MLKMKNHHLAKFAAALLVLPCLPGAANAAKLFEGAFTVSYTNGPSHALEGSVCVVFTHTGDVLGFSDSGTWAANSAGEGGNFVVDQGILRFYGPVIENVYMINHYAPVPDKFTSGTYDRWIITKPLTAQTDGTFTMSKGCAGG
jgi:hypothetical protein